VSTNPSKIKEHTPDPSSREPLRQPAVWAALVTALLAVVAAFGLDIPVDARVALVGLAGTVGPLAVWYVGRRKAWSGATVAEQLTKPADQP
jgi:Na+/H+ antiporter NhaD/arsenite permease-like protein